MNPTELQTLIDSTTTTMAVAGFTLHAQGQELARGHEIKTVEYTRGNSVAIITINHVPE